MQKCSFYTTVERFDCRLIVTMGDRNCSCQGADGATFGGEAKNSRLDTVLVGIFGFDINIDGA